MRRRSFLATGTAALLALAGCRSDGTGDDGAAGTGTMAGDGVAETGDGTTTDEALGTPAPGDGSVSGSDDVISKRPN